MRYLLFIALAAVLIWLANALWQTGFLGRF
jgi:hypothetical protein